MKKYLLAAVATFTLASSQAFAQLNNTPYLNTLPPSAYGGGHGIGGALPLPQPDSGMNDIAPLPLPPMDAPSPNYNHGTDLLLEGYSYTPRHREESFNGASSLKQVYSWYMDVAKRCDNK